MQTMIKSKKALVNLEHKKSGKVTSSSIELVEPKDKEIELGEVLRLYKTEDKLIFIDEESIGFIYFSLV